MKTSIKDWLFAHQDLDRLDRELLVCETLSLTRAQVIARPERLLDGATLKELASWVDRLRDGEPLAYLSGRKEFWGLTFTVSPDVLIPRPETECLVERAIDLASASHGEKRILDLGTGSGAIAVAITHSLTAARSTGEPNARVYRVYGSDRSVAALRLAQENANHHNVSIQWLESDWFSDIADSFDLIVSNPPYVAQNDPHLAALRYEPSTALCAGVDGLDALRIIVPAAYTHLVPGGWLLVEHGYNQESAVQRLFTEQGYQHIRTERDLGGQPRVTQGQRINE